MKMDFIFKDYRCGGLKCVGECRVQGTRPKKFRSVIDSRVLVFYL